jgi:hypothetical protein
MKKIILGLLIVFAACQIVSAQTKREGKHSHMTPQQRTEQRVRRMDSKLNLTDEQKEQIRKFCAEFNKQIFSHTKKERKIELVQLNKKIISVLTTEQQVLYQKIQEEIAKRKKAGNDKQKSN